MQLVIFSNNINSSEEFDNAQTNNPIVRKYKIIDCLEKHIKNLETHEINSEIDSKWLKSIHDPSYLEFLSECYDSFDQSADISWSDPNKGLVPCNFYKIMPNPSVPIYKLSGFYGCDTMTPIYKQTWSNALISANQAFNAATHLHFNPKDVVYVLATSPGHHAKTAEYGGYCFINNAMVSAQQLIELHSAHNGIRKNIAILDLDYHAGNGTYEMAQNKKNIYAYSIHCDPVYDYPSFDGFSDEYNYVLKPHSDWNTYEIVLRMVLEKIRGKFIGALIIAFGGDTFKDDPDAISIGRFELDLSSYTQMGKIIREYFPTMPILITQEGGYNMDHIGNIVCNFMQGLITY